MTGSEFVALWPRLRVLRQDIPELARAFTREPEHQRWLIRMAWAKVGNMPADKTTEYYRGRAYAIMRVKYERYIRVPDGRSPSRDNGVRRAYEKMQKLSM